MRDFESEKIVNRFAESTGQKFTKIPDEVIAAQRLVNLMQDELNFERAKVKQDSFAIQIIEAKLIGEKRKLTALVQKHKL